MIVKGCICWGPCVAIKRDNKNLQQDTRSEREQHLSREKKLKRTSEGGSEAEVLKIASEVSEVVKVRSSTKDERTVNTKINNWDWDVIIIWGCYDENQTTIRQRLLFHLSRAPSLPAGALCPIPIPSDVVLVALASSKPLSLIFGWPALPWLSPCFTRAAVWP